MTYSRREAFTTIGAVGLAAVAGCLGGSENNYTEDADAIAEDFYSRIPSEDSVSHYTNDDVLVFEFDTNVDNRKLVSEAFDSLFVVVADVIDEGDYTVPNVRMVSDVLESYVDRGSFIAYINDDATQEEFVSFIDYE